MKGLTNVRIYDFHKYEKRGYVLFTDTIIESGPMEAFGEARKKHALADGDIMDGKGRLLTPGLVLGHTHIYSTFARGMALPFNPEDFQQILEQLWWKMDGSLDREQTYWSGMCSALGYMKHGVTTVIDHHASGKDIKGTLAELKRSVVTESGLRGMFCFETSDRFDIPSCIEENMSFFDEEAQGVCSAHFGMHASMTLSDDTLKKISGRLGGRPIHIHVAESAMDGEDSRRKYGTGIIKRLDKFGLLTPDSLIVHGIFLEEEEMDILAERKCSMVLNPLSNMNNGVGFPDYPALKKHGIKCFIGNDGLGTAVANEWQALLFGTHYKYGDPRVFDLGDLHTMIVNSYEYASRRLGIKLGRIEKDYAADMILIDETNFTPMNENNALGHLVFGSAFALRPSHTWCRGELKLAEYEHTFPTDNIYEKSREASSRLWKDLGAPL
ncbi:MAG: amidohydrolase family protein [Spirochaetales bacterium]|nr:amidohydrolase family protein [Spirochaetales bacterium]